MSSVLDIFRCAVSRTPNARVDTTSRGIRSGLAQAGLGAFAGADIVRNATATDIDLRRIGRLPIGLSWWVIREREVLAAFLDEVSLGLLLILWPQASVETSSREGMWERGRTSDMVFERLGGRSMLGCESSGFLAFCVW